MMMMMTMTKTTKTTLTPSEVIETTKLATMEALHIETGSNMQQRQESAAEQTEKKRNTQEGAPAKPPRLRHENIQHVNNNDNNNKDKQKGIITTTTTSDPAEPDTISSRTITVGIIVPSSLKSTKQHHRQLQQQQQQHLHHHGGLHEKKHLQFQSPLLSAATTRRTTNVERRRRHQHQHQHQQHQHQHHQQQRRRDQQTFSNVITTTKISTTPITPATKATTQDAVAIGKDKVIAMPNITLKSCSGGGRLAQGCTSLMYACQHGDVAQVLEQMRAKPELIRQRDSRNKNALHYCAAQNVQQTRDLVAAASIAIAAPELLESADEDGFTPLHLAVIQGNLAMVNLLLANKADVNAVDNEGHSVVHWATVCGEVEALRSVLAAGANVAKPDINGGSPLHYGAQMCGANYEGKVGQSNSSKLALEILGILLTHPQCSVEVQDKDGRQPLLWAASAGSAKAVIALVKAGARVESADKDGLTSLHCAASRGHTECIDTLISLCGAPTDLIDSNGCTALHYAVTLGHADATARLLDLEADPNRQDRKGRTPAHCGCSKGQFETLKLLKERGANLWLRNAKGDLPMHEAASSGRRELVEWLLEQRPKQVNTTSNDGRSMLHIAAANDYTDMCKLLLDYGGDINALYRNSKGLVMTPLDCALQRGHRSTAKFLQSHGGLPSNKLRLAARRENPFREATSDMVRPLKYVEKEEIQDLRNSKKYVVYLKRSDSDGGNGNGGGVAEEGDCSCTEQTYRREQRYEHICRRHKRRHLRRRTSSCGEAKHSCHDKDCSEICRSKSNIEIRLRKSRERYASSSDLDHAEDEDDEDSCENCCYHKRQKQRVIQRKRSSSMRRSKDSKDTDDEGKSDGENKKPTPALESKSDGKEQQIEILQERPMSSTARPNSKTSAQSRPQSASKRKTPPSSATKEATFIKSPPQSAKSEQTLPIIESHVVDLTDDEPDANKAAQIVTTQVDVHREAEEVTTSKEELVTMAEQTAEGVEEVSGKSEMKHELSEEDTKEVAKEVEQVIIIAATALNSESKSSSEEVTSVKEDEQQEKEKQQVDAVAESIKPSETSEKNVDENKSVEPPKLAETDVIIKNNETKTDIKEATAAPPKSGETQQSMEKTEATQKDSMPGTAVTKTDSLKTDPKPEPKQLTKQQQNTPPPPPTSAQKREQESRRSFSVLPSDSADDENAADIIDDPKPDEPERKSSFQVLKSDESVGDLEEDEGNGLTGPHDVELSDSQVFKIVHDDSPTSKLHSDTELSSPERGMKDQSADFEYEEYEYDDAEAEDVDDDGATTRRYLGSGNRHGVGGISVAGDDDAAIAGIYEMGSGRKRRLKKRVRSGAKSRSNWKQAQDAREGAAATTSKDHDSGFEPSPRATKTKIPTPRNIYTAYMPRRPVYATLDGRSCSSRLENRKPGDKGACDMAAVTRSIQRNIRRYYMERKIFQHLLELKSLQIRSNKLNEAVLVKRAVDDYHKSCLTLGGETGTRLRRYNFSEYTFKNFELFLYETLKGLQKPGTYNFQNINEVYEEAERRLSPDYNAYEKALQCTTKTHRCLHAAHAYTGIPCAAYIPMMNHHTMPKFGFGPYKKTTVSSFYLPKILTSGGCGAGGLSHAGGAGCGGKVALELSHGKSKQLISLPSEKLDSNKRYYVTFTVKESAAAAAASAAADAHKQQQQQQQQQQKDQQQQQKSSEAAMGTSSK